MGATRRTSTAPFDGTVSEPKIRRVEPVITSAEAVDFVTSVRSYNFPASGVIALRCAHHAKIALMGNWIDAEQLIRS
jgi:hypothetical protein